MDKVRESYIRNQKRIKRNRIILFVITAIIILLTIFIKDFWEKSIAFMIVIGFVLWIPFAIWLFVFSSYPISDRFWLWDIFHKHKESEDNKNE